MAIVTDPLIGTFHGSIGGLTFFKTPQYQLVRMKVNPKITMSNNVRLENLLLTQTAISWGALDSPTKALWDTYANTLFTPHNETPHYPYKGFQAYMGLYKLWLEANSKICSLTYRFDGGAIISPVSQTLPQFSVVPRTFPYYQQIMDTIGTSIPFTPNVYDFSSAGIVSLHLDYPHSPVPPLLLNDWINSFGERYGFAFWCSEPLPYKGSLNYDYWRYFIGWTGWIQNPPGTMANSQNCDIFLDCSNVIALNSSFAQPGQYVWISYGTISEFGRWWDNQSFCVLIS